MDDSVLNRGREALKKEFANPGAPFRGKPFWSWNGELEEEELKRQVDVLKEMGFGGFFMHSRTGLATEYLGEEWFDLCNKICDYGTSRGMEAWLYDEDRWPSGSAGGIVTRDPKYRMKSLYMFEAAPDDTAAPENPVGIFEAVFDRKSGELKRFMPVAPGGKTVLGAAPDEEKKVLKFGIVYDAPNSNYNGTTYIDTMMREATDRFIELTHEQYKARGEGRIGTSMKGIFTDEPHRGHLLDNLKTDGNGFSSCGIFYTDDIFAEFEKRYGYDAKKLLPELFCKANSFESSFALKRDYIDLGDNLFLERFAKPINDWCVANHIDFTGHVLHENSLTNQTVPEGSLMRFYEYEGAPGIDLLTEWDSAYWVAKQVQSAARQLDKKWILSELYGCTGWQFNFRSHKAVGDWQALYGVNLRCPHLSWYTMEGEAKRDYPASILHQSSYYKDYAYVEDYFARFGVVTTEGKPVCDVLVLNPIESIWTMVYAGWAHWISSVDGPVNRLEENYRNLFETMRRAHVDFDYGEEQMMAEHGSVGRDRNGAWLRIGSMVYRTVVLSGAVTVRRTTLELLKEFADLGGKVVVLGEAPVMVDARHTDAFRKELRCETGDLSEESVRRLVRPAEKVRVDFVCRDGDAFHYQLRDAGEKDGLMLLAAINADRDRAMENTRITLEGIPGVMGVTEWCLTDGTEKPVKDVRIKDGTVEIVCDFMPAGEKVFALDLGKPCGKQDDIFENAAADKTEGKAPDCVELTGPFGYRLDEKNVMVLDYASAEFTDLEGKKYSFSKDEILHLDRKIRDVAGIERRGGAMLQPWYAKKFVNEKLGRLTLIYQFNVAKLPEEDVILAGERPDLMAYTLNGTALRPDGGFWIDVCMKTMRVPKELLKEGVNQIAAETEFHRTTNPECLYLVGDFGVTSVCTERNPAARLGERGKFYGEDKVMTELPRTLTGDNLMDQGLLFFTGCVSYEVTPEMLAGLRTEPGKRAYLRSEGYVGSLLKVTDPDGNRKQVLAWEPYEADVTDYLNTGFLVTLVCSRKNMFGPLHQIPAVPGATGPENFVTGGDNFSRDYVMMDSNPGKLTIEVR